MWDDLVEELVEELKPDKPIVVGVSGGVDSVVLLHLLERVGVPLICVHINFHLRGEESNRDEAFVRRLFTEKYPHHHLKVYVADTVAYAKEHRVSIEMAARDIRYAHFKRVAEQEGAALIALGHHKNDQAETFFINLLRGTGGRGLVGMQRYSKGLFRPLLEKSREEIEAYQQAYGLECVFDSTNDDTDILRNAIRHRVLPLLEELRPNFLEILTQSMSVFAEEQSLIDHATDRFWSKRWDEVTQSFDLSELEDNEHLPLLMFRGLQPLGFSYQQVEDLLNNSKRSGAYFTSKKESLRLELFRERVYLVTLPLPKCEVMVLEQEGQRGWRTGLGELLFQEGYVDKPHTIYIEVDALHDGVEVRCAKSTDRFTPFGMRRGSKRLYEYLKEQGIPAIYRPACIVIADGDEIIAVPPLQVSEHAKVVAHPVSITFTPNAYPLSRLLLSLR